MLKNLSYMFCQPTDRIAAKLHVENYQVYAIILADLLSFFRVDSAISIHRLLARDRVRFGYNSAH